MTDYLLNTNFNIGAFGYPSLGSNYTPNLSMDARILRFINAQEFIDDIIDDKLLAEKKAMSEAINTSQIESFNVIAKTNFNSDNVPISISFYSNQFLSADDYSIEIMNALDPNGYDPVQNTNPTVLTSEAGTITLTFNSKTGYVYISFENTDFYNYYLVTQLLVTLSYNCQILYTISSGPNTAVIPPTS